MTVIRINIYDCNENSYDILIMSKFRFCLYWVFLVAWWVKNLLTMKTQEMWFRSLGWENPLEKEMASLSSILLPGKSHGQKGLASYSPGGHKESDMTE